MATKPNEPAEPREIPNQEPPLIGAAADKQEQKALQQYRHRTLAESSKFRTDVRRNWKDSANNALHLVASAAKEQKRQVLVDQADSLLASRTGERARDSIIARCQIGQNIPGVSIECLVSWSTADVRADLARAVIPNFDFEFVRGHQPPKRDPRFYHELTKDWMRDVYAGYDRTISKMLDGAPAWAALDDGRTVAQKFENDRKRIRSSSELPEVKNAEIATLDRIEKNGRCTPYDTKLLWNEIAEKLESAIEYRAVPDVHDELLPLMADENKPSGLSKFDEFAGRLYYEALCESSRHRVSKESLKRIVEQLDGSQFAEPLEYLEPSHRSQLGDNNKRYPRDPIKTWTRLISSRKFRGFAIKALNRASSKFSRNIARRSF